MASQRRLKTPRTSWWRWGVGSMTLPLIIISAVMSVGLAGGEAEAERKMASAVIFDLGSTGSRLHKFDYEVSPGVGGMKLFLPETTVKIKPGLATHISIATTSALSDMGNGFAGNGAGDGLAKLAALENAVSQYLLRLKKEIDRIVPFDKRRLTPVFFVATAGVRHLSPRKQRQSIKSFRRLVRDVWAHEYHTCDDWTFVLQGTLEGLYAWMVLVQLMQHAKTGAEEGKGTVRAMTVRGLPEEGPLPTLVEFGGASMQVVAPMRSGGDAASPNDSDVSLTPALEKHTYLFKYYNQTRVMHIRSFLGLGRQLAMQRFLSRNSNKGTVPCLPGDLKFNAKEGEADRSGAVIEDLAEYQDKQQQQQQGDSSLQAQSSYLVCQRAVRDSLMELSQQHCPQTDLPPSFIVGSENFYHMTEMVLNVSNVTKHVLTPRELKDRAAALCALPSVAQVAASINPRAEAEKAVGACFGLTVMAEFLQSVLCLGDDQGIAVLKEVAGVEVAWPAGFVITDLLKHLDRACVPPKLNLDDEL